MDCIFCKIAKKEVKSSIVFEDDDIMAFRDLAPQAPVHLLVIPKKHIPTINDLAGDDISIVSKMISVVLKLAKDSGIADAGYRTVINCGRQGGQSVYHLHMHLIGGRQLGGSMVG